MQARIAIPAFNARGMPRHAQPRREEGRRDRRAPRHPGGLARGPLLNDAERAALALTDYDEPALAALVVHIAAINTRNRLNASQVRLPGSGQHCG
jgi:hypothetical protein